MPHYLYTHTAHPNSSTGTTISGEGFTYTATLNGALSYVKSTCTINTPTDPTYHNQNVGTGVNSAPVSDPGPLRRVSDSGGIPPGYTEGWSFSLLFGDASLSGNRGNINQWNTALGTTAEVDWFNNQPDLTWHSPLANESTYTLVVPNDFFVYTDGSIAERNGSTLAFHIPVGSLGVWGQNANLPDGLSGVVYTDTDEQAAGKILYMGYMLFLGQTTTPFMTLN
jgi:hypothetical protein